QLSFVTEIAEKINTSEKFRDVHNLLKRISGYVDPRKLGHEFRGFLKDFTNLFESWCSGRLIDYMNSTLSQIPTSLAKSKERIIEGGVEEGAMPREAAEKLIDLIVSYYSQPVPIVMDDTRKSLCMDAQSIFGRYLESINTAERCLELTTQFVEKVEEQAETVYNRVLREYEASLLVTMKIKELLSGLAELAGLIPLPKALSEKRLEELLKIIVVDNLDVFMSIPLHICLSRYYNDVRYGKVQEDELKTLPDVIRLLRNIHEKTENIFSLIYHYA
ncbi:MAG: hypothetical protein QW320_09685, partial [Ignisphaera sp.]